MALVSVAIAGAGLVFYRPAQGNESENPLPHKPVITMLCTVFIWKNWQKRLYERNMSKPLVKHCSQCAILGLCLIA